MNGKTFMQICLERYPAERMIDESHYSSCFYSAVQAVKAKTMSREDFVTYINKGFVVVSPNENKTKPGNSPFNNPKNVRKGE